VAPATMTPLQTIQEARSRLAAGAKSCEGAIVRFLRDLVAIPAETGHEGPVIQRIRQEMESVGFDEIRVDPMEISWAASVRASESS